jgi:dihydrofolate synthase/folylpolyglutamate synthase
MNLDGWLAYIERQHVQPIALGLDRVREVAARLGQKKLCPLILVGGTNGKGSTCAMLENILRCAGYRVGLYTSPHLTHYNERVRIDGRSADDAALCDGFAKVEAARGVIPLTYFEFGTLAAWEVFAAEALDAIILEVGLGGRLDATNIHDPDVAIVTSVDLDHQDYLGDTREAIGFEKAGIFRAGKPAICADARPPQSLLDHCQAIAPELLLIGRDFGYEPQDRQWLFWGRQGRRSGLAWPALRGVVQLANASSAIVALDCLRDSLPVTMQDIRRGLIVLELPGRFQVLPGRPTQVVDVAHNPQAARVLADNLGNMAFHPTTWAIFGMLADKDIAGVIDAVKHRVDIWLPCSLEGPRAASADTLGEYLRTAGAKVAATFDSPGAALDFAKARAGGDDRILAFGSFLTVAEILRHAT